MALFPIDSFHVLFFIFVQATTQCIFLGKCLDSWKNTVEQINKNEIRMHLFYCQVVNRKKIFICEFNLIIFINFTYFLHAIMFAQKKIIKILYKTRGPFVACLYKYNINKFMQLKFCYRLMRSMLAYKLL